MGGDAGTALKGEEVAPKEEEEEEEEGDWCLRFVSRPWLEKAKYCFSSGLDVSREGLEDGRPPEGKQLGFLELCWSGSLKLRS